MGPVPRSVWRTLSDKSIWLPISIDFYWTWQKYKRCSYLLSHEFKWIIFFFHICLSLEMNDRLLNILVTFSNVVWIDLIHRVLFLFFFVWLFLHNILKILETILHSKMWECNYFIVIWNLIFIFLGWGWSSLIQNFLKSLSTN